MVSTKETPFESLLNFRDVGKSISSLSNQATLKPSLLYRSARPDNATKADQHQLTATYGIKTILDLRTPTEHLEQARKLGLRVPTAPAARPSDPNYPLRIPDIEYKEVNFNGSAYSKALIKQLSYGHVAKLGVLYACGWRTQAISVLGTNVMAKRGLTGLAEDSLEHCTAEVRACFDVLADKSSYPVLVHCTQGKDRTGLIVLLVLLLLNAPKEAIEKDYRLSESELQPEREERLKEITSIGLPESFADCPADWVEKVSGWITDKYGAVEAYLASCGVSKEQMESVRAILKA